MLFDSMSDRYKRIVELLKKLEKQLSGVRQISIVRAVASFFAICAFLFIYLFASSGGFQRDPWGLGLVLIEICAGVAITLFVVERALDAERGRAQSQFASLDRLSLGNSLAELIVFAYIRLLKGETGDIYQSFSDINDPRPWELFLYRGKLDPNKMVPLIKDMAAFSAQDYLLGIGENSSQFLELSRSDEIANRFYAYVSDTTAITRNLPTVISRAIQTSSAVSDRELLNEIEDLARDHEKAVAPLKSKHEAAQRYRDISNTLTLMVEYYSELESISKENWLNGIIKKLKHWWLPYEY